MTLTIRLKYQISSSILLCFCLFIFIFSSYYCSIACENTIFVHILKIQHLMTLTFTLKKIIHFSIVFLLTDVLFLVHDVLFLVHKPVVFVFSFMYLSKYCPKTCKNPIFPHFEFLHLMTLTFILQTTSSI